MHLEKNLNPTYRVFRVLTGVVLLAVPLWSREIFSGWLTGALILGGLLAIASGAYGH